MCSCDPVIAALQRDLGSGRCGAWPRGAIGRFDGSRAEFGYPEIAGYWLGWAAHHPVVTQASGSAVIAWLASVSEGDGRLPTRPGDGCAVHRHTWYLFDHAMVWHGLGQWAMQRGCAQALTLREQVGATLALFVREGRPRAAMGRENPRWPGTAGPFLLKPLARVRHDAGIADAPLTEAVQMLTSAALTAPHVEAHPQLYAIEGLWLLGNDEAADRALTALLAQHGGIAELRETPGHGPRRNDVLAQALRMALLLGWPIRRRRDWTAAVQELIGQVGWDGRMPFSGCDARAPTWTSLFTEQALRLWRGERIDYGALA